jgi:hypothetical protein
LTRGVVFRGIGFAVAIALGAVAVWLIVTSDTQKQLQLGVLAGLWGGMVGAFALFGSRRFAHPLDAPELAEYGGHQPGSAIELRSSATEVERAEEAAARRAHEVRLENMLRREIQSTVGREVTALRSEIAALRSELVEKVGGQIRLERIETTRVIGSDLEALQHEVRQLKYAAQDTGDIGTTWSRPRTPEPAPIRPVVEPARVRPVSRQTAEVEATVQPARPSFAPDPAPAPPAPAGSTPAPRLVVTPSPPTLPATPAASPIPTDATAPIRIGGLEPNPAKPALAPTSASVVSPPAPVVVSPPAPVVAPAPAPPPEIESPTPLSAAVQPSPPVIRLVEPSAATPEPRPQPPAAPSTAPQPPAEPSAAPASPAAPSAAAAPAPATPTFPVDDFASLPRIRPFTEFELDPIEDEPAYTGRRRRGEEIDAAGRHSHSAERPMTRRHRRAEDAEESESDLLARLLARGAGN